MNFINMNIKRNVAVGFLLLSSSNAMAVNVAASPEQVVGTMEAIFGVTPGERRNHTKGTCAVGEFVGSKAAAKVSRSVIFSGKPVPVVARFSLAGGNPNAPDSANSPRGMALEFLGENGAIQHMTMLNTPVFGAATPGTFYEGLMARLPDPATGKPDPDKIKAFKESHPDTKAQAAFMASNNPPVSYANSAYHGIHTFKFINKDNVESLVRWQFVPRDGEKRLSDAEMSSSPTNFLEQSLIKRVDKTAVQWDMVVTLGESGDVQNDPTVAWPEGRKQITAGTLTISQAMPQKGAACEGINYDPLLLSEGIVATDDPVLLFRSPAYAVSFSKRQSE